MSFHLIDFQTWERKEFYEHFINEVVCSYSTTVNVDNQFKKQAALSHDDLDANQIGEPNA